LAKYNLKEAKEQPSQFSVITEGRYDLEVVDAELGTSKSGNEKINVQFKIIDGSEFAGRRVWDNLTFTSTALWKVIQFLTAAKSPLIEKTSVDPAEVAMEIIGAKVSGYITPGRDSNDNPVSTLNQYVAISTSPASTKNKSTSLMS
jgi:hypothetical protein